MVDRRSRGERDDIDNTWRKIEKVKALFLIFWFLMELVEEDPKKDD